MTKKQEYIITDETSIILPEFDETGKLNAIVLEGSKLHKVDLKPSQIIDNSLRYYGSSLRGAGDGARAILGNVSMAPVMISEAKDLFWFPSMSPANPTCVWFANHQIETCAAYGKKATKVVLKNGCEVIIALTLETFEGKVERTCRFKYRIKGRTSGKFIAEAPEVYVISKEPNALNYDLWIKE